MMLEWVDGACKDAKYATGRQGHRYAIVRIFNEPFTVWKDKGLDLPLLVSAHRIIHLAIDAAQAHDDEWHAGEESTDAEPVQKP